MTETSRKKKHLDEFNEIEANYINLNEKHRNSYAQTPYCYFSNAQQPESTIKLQLDLNDCESTETLEMNNREKNHVRYDIQKKKKVSEQNTRSISII